MAKRNPVVTGQQTTTGTADRVVNMFELGRYIDASVEKAMACRVGESRDLDMPREDPRIPTPPQPAGPGLQEQFYLSRQRCDDRHQSLTDDIARLQQRVGELEVLLYGAPGTLVQKR